MEPEAEPEPDFTDADGKPKDKEKKAPLKRSGVRKQALSHMPQAVHKPCMQTPNAPPSRKKQYSFARTPPMHVLSLFAPWQQR